MANWSESVPPQLAFPCSAKSNLRVTRSINVLGCPSLCWARYRKDARFVKWTTRLWSCGLWRYPAHGYSIGKRSLKRRRLSTGLGDSSWRSVPWLWRWAMYHHHWHAGVLVRGSKPNNGEALRQQGLRRIEMQKAAISSSLNIVKTFKATVNKRSLRE